MALPDPNFTIEGVHTAIASGDLSGALDKVDSVFKMSRVPAKMVDELTECRGRLADLDRASLKGAIDGDGESAERSRIMSSILELARHYEAFERGDEASTPWPRRKRT